MPSMPALGSHKSTPIKKSASGRLVSAKSKTGNPECSQAMSTWKTQGMTPAVAAVLGRCRSMAYQKSRAAGARAAGNEAKAQHWEHNAERGMTLKARAAKAKELRANRATPQAGPSAKSPLDAATANVDAGKPMMPPVRSNLRSRPMTAHEARAKVKVEPSVMFSGLVPKGKMKDVEHLSMSGNTFANREAIGETGATWNAKSKSWDLSGKNIGPTTAGELSYLQKQGVKFSGVMSVVKRVMPQRGVKSAQVTRSPEEWAKIKAMAEPVSAQATAPVDRMSKVDAIRKQWAQMKADKVAAAGRRGVKPEAPKRAPASPVSKPAEPFNITGREHAMIADRKELNRKFAQEERATHRALPAPVSKVTSPVSQAAPVASSVARAPLERFSLSSGPARRPSLFGDDRPKARAQQLPMDLNRHDLPGQTSFLGKVGEVTMKNTGPGLQSAAEKKAMKAKGRGTPERLQAAENIRSGKMQARLRGFTAAGYRQQLAKRINKDEKSIFDGSRAMAEYDKQTHLPRAVAYHEASKRASAVLARSKGSKPVSANPVATAGSGSPETTRGSAFRKAQADYLREDRRALAASRKAVGEVTSRTAQPWIHTGSSTSPGTGAEIHGEGGPQRQNPIPQARFTAARLAKATQIKAARSTARASTASSPAPARAAVEARRQRVRDKIQGRKDAIADRLFRINQKDRLENRDYAERDALQRMSGQLDTRYRRTQTDSERYVDEVKQRAARRDQRHGDTASVVKRAAQRVLKRANDRLVSAKDSAGFPTKQWDWARDINDRSTSAVARQLAPSGNEGSVDRLTAAKAIRDQLRATRSNRRQVNAGSVIDSFKKHGSSAPLLLGNQKTPAIVRSSAQEMSRPAVAGKQESTVQVTAGLSKGTRSLIHSFKLADKGKGKKRVENKIRNLENLRRSAIAARQPEKEKRFASHLGKLRKMA